MRQAKEELFTVDADMFDKAYRIAASMVDTSSTIDYGRYVRVEADLTGQRLVMRSNRVGQMEIRCVIPAEVKGDDTFYLDKEKTQKRLPYMPGAALTVKRLGVGEIELSSGGVRTTLKHGDVYSFPDDVTDHMQPVASFSADMFGRALRGALPLVSKKLSDITGAMCVRLEGEEITVIGANPMRGIVRYVIPAKNVQAESPRLELLIPRFAVEQLAGMIGKADLVISQNEGGSSFALTWGGTTFSSIMMYGEYPNLDAIFTMQPVSSASVPREDLLGILGLVSANNINKDQDARAVFDFGAEQLSVTSDGQFTEGEAEAQIPCIIDGTQAVVVLNADALKPVIQELRSEYVELGLTSKGHVRVAGEHDPWFLHYAACFRFTLKDQE